MTFSLDQFSGCVLGLATGDVLGAPYEGGLVERFAWRLFGRTWSGCRRWTDDTQMAVDLAESLLEQKDVSPDALAKRFAESYRWTRGYGPGAARVLKRIRGGENWLTASKSVYPEGSFGNGAAMRSPVAALFFADSRERLVASVKVQSRITHAHPLGIEGAVLVALAAHALLERQPPDHVLELVERTCSASEFLGRLKTMAGWFRSDSQPSPRDVAAQLGNGVRAYASCPTAVYIALRHIQLPFEQMMRFVIHCGGDVDTIGAMSGALWGIANGPAGLPLVNLEAREQLVGLASRLFQWQTSRAFAEQTHAPEPTIVASNIEASLRRPGDA